jgi:hypothetical protein
MTTIRDPQVEAVRRIANSIGYGRLMNELSSMWRELLVPQGLAGGEFAVGVCQGSLERAGARDSLELLMAWEQVPLEQRTIAMAAARKEYNDRYVNDGDVT